MRFWTEISDRLAGLTGVASPEETRAALNEFDVRDIQAVRVSENSGGGGGGGNVPFVGVDPPADPTDGMLWWDPDDDTPSNGSQPGPVGPFEWSFEDFVGEVPGVYDNEGYPGIVVAPKGTFAQGSIVHRIFWQIDTALNNLSGSGNPTTNIGDPVTGYGDGGDMHNTASDVPGDISLVGVAESDQVSNLNVALSPSGAQSPVALRTGGAGGVLIGASNQFFWIEGNSFTDPPTQGAGRCWFEILTPVAPS